mmetsp:Transcript_28073/g.58480  ORF Transcript_28073/g.58480 Transcript_28073/m.58480 type:complete len:348 (-) Transcript_28073:1384-2427(-)
MELSFFAACILPSANVPPFHRFRVHVASHDETDVRIHVQSNDCFNDKRTHSCTDQRSNDSPDKCSIFSAHCSHAASNNQSDLSAHEYVSSANRPGNQFPSLDARSHRISRHPQSHHPPSHSPAHFRADRPSHRPSHESAHHASPDQISDRLADQSAHPKAHDATHRRTLLRSHHSGADPISRRRTPTHAIAHRSSSFRHSHRLSHHREPHDASHHRDSHSKPQHLAHHPLPHRKPRHRHRHPDDRRRTVPQTHHTASRLPGPDENDVPRAVVANASSRVGRLDPRDGGENQETQRGGIVQGRGRRNRRRGSIGRYSAVDFGGRKKRLDENREAGSPIPFRRDGHPRQ